jgi:hypothetical protein
MTPLKVKLEEPLGAIFTEANTRYHHLSTELYLILCLSRIDQTTTATLNRETMNLTGSLKNR